MTLALKDFATIRDEVYRKLGLFFEDSKVYFIQKRIEKRMEALGVQSFADYGFLLRFGDKEGKELQALANLVTTNETYMFREFEQLQAFADHCLPMILKPREEGAYSREICNRPATKPAAPPRRKTDRDIFKTRSKATLSDLGQHGWAKGPVITTLLKVNGEARLDQLTRATRPHAEA